MRTAIAIGSSALALTAAACAPQARPLASTLSCPASQGALTRETVAPNGQSCVYRGLDGTEVVLRRVAVTGSPDATLTVIEDGLRAEAPGAFVKAEVLEGASSAAADAARVAAEAAADAKAPGVSVQADSSDGEEADVRLPGIHIRAKGEDADVQVGPIKIRANDGEAVIRVQRDVRLKGEATSRERRGVRATLILARKGGFEGYKVLGYEAGGPKAGPLTVATIKGRDGDTDRLYDDVKRLVRRNSGV